MPGCVCAFTPTIPTWVQFWILMHPKERLKPTNTARLIAATMPQTRIFLWERTNPPEAFVALLQDAQFRPYLLFPGGDPQTFARFSAPVHAAPQTPAFILLDGTWPQARKMLLRSPYLYGVPRLTIHPQAPSAYRLRQQHYAEHLSTVEVAIALLHQVEEAAAGTLLSTYFQAFVDAVMTTRHGHAWQDLFPAQAPPGDGCLPESSDLP